MRMPEGIEVVERRVGRAVGQWILEVRCECGRRWFELEAVDTGKCPRCGALVLIRIEVAAPPTVTPLDSVTDQAWPLLLQTRASVARRP